MFSYRCHRLWPLKKKNPSWMLLKYYGNINKQAESNPTNIIFPLKTESEVVFCFFPLTHLHPMQIFYCPFMMTKSSSEEKIKQSFSSM